MLPGVSVSVTTEPEENRAEQVPPLALQLVMPIGELETVPRPTTVCVSVKLMKNVAEPVALSVQPFFIPIAFTV
jgi:hypothetical protein